VSDHETESDRSLSDVLSLLSASFSRLGRLIFGDRLGLTIFVGALLFYMVFWRIGFFLSDDITLANTLANLADGRLAVTESPYSLTAGSQPGLVEIDGQFYGRNYGHLFVALPFVWLLELIDMIADLRVVLAGLFSLLLVGFAGLLDALSRRTRLTAAGAMVALAIFLGNVATATPLPLSSQGNDQFELLALQLSTMLVAALTATVMYRLARTLHGRRVGAVAGTALVLATPHTFWASIPKRHILTACVVVVTLYCFAVSREDGRLRPRATAYVALGLLTALHSFEAAFLFLVFAPLDFLTAPFDGRRTAVLGLVFALALLPMLLVNAFISGNPLRPPRLLPRVDQGGFPGAPELGGTGGEDPTAGGDTGGNGGSGSGGNGGDSSGETAGDDSSLWSFVPAPVVRALGSSREILGFIDGSLIDGVRAATDPGRLYHTFIRSGWIPGLRYEVNDFEAINLALLESMPLLGALAWLPVAAVRRINTAGPVVALRSAIPRTPARQTDLLAASYAFVFTLVYLPRLPLFAQITVRYILPVMPILLYAVIRIGPVRQTVQTELRVLTGSYLLTVLAGGLLVIGALWVAEPAAGEAVQLHALLGGAVAIASVLAVVTWPVHEDLRAVAVGLAVPAAATTLFVVLSTVVYFAYGPFALDLIRVFADALPSL